MVALDWFHGPRSELAELFSLADDSAAAIAAYRDDGDVLVAREGDRVVGHAQVLRHGDEELEVKSLAVLPAKRRAGIGRRLLERVAAEARARGYARVVLSTATADVELLRYYQRLGFRLVRVEPDVFTPENGYPEVTVDGIPLRDRVWLACEP
jgi:ribosomal protein S18 acetylase RimI-like enzyme